MAQALARAAAGWRREPRWDEVLSAWRPSPTQDGLLSLAGGAADTYTTWNWEHPALVGAYGMQPGDGVDPETMRRTLRKVLEDWQWDRCWGWDYPMAAMSAARAGGSRSWPSGALLIDSPKNRYRPTATTTSARA